MNYKALEMILKQPVFSELPELIPTISIQKERYVILSSDAVYGDIDDLLPGIAALSCLHASIILMDDILDEDIREYYHQIGFPQAANAALILQACSHLIVESAELQENTRIPIHKSLFTIAHNTGLGQQLDSKKLVGEEHYWKVTKLKSGSFFAGCFQIGAILAGTELQKQIWMKRFGELIGEIVQVHDDVKDTMQTEHGVSQDWQQKRYPLPILFAVSVNHPEKERFMQLHAGEITPDSLDEAREIILRSGALSYCLDQILRKYQAGLHLLDEMDGVNKDLLINMLRQDILIPVLQLMSYKEIPSDTVIKSQMEYFESQL
ncbi:MAG: polyprenyl synthetase family protein [Anaerolineales bacterium]|nr:polyprenyl synthetase family protein [Anaerolineales bacterium]